MHVLILPTRYPNWYNQESNIFFKDQAEALASVDTKLSILALIPITIQDILRKKRLKFGLGITESKNIITYSYLFPVPPKSKWIQQIIRGVVGKYLIKKYILKDKTPDVVHVHTFIAASKLPNVVLNICTRKSDWDKVSLNIEPTPYWQFLMPSKILTYLQFGKPICVTENTKVSNFVNTHRIGVSVPYSEDGIYKGLKKIISNKNIYSENSTTAVKFSLTQTWSDRATEAATKILMT